MAKTNKADLMTGKTLGFDAMDEHGNFKGSYSFRCMNCGEITPFVPTLDWKHFCCVKCTCIGADRDQQTEVDMSKASWQLTDWLGE